MDTVPEVLGRSALVSLILYAAALGLYLSTPREVFQDPASVRLWILVLLVAAIAARIRDT